MIIDFPYDNTNSWNIVILDIATIDTAAATQGTDPIAVSVPRIKINTSAARCKQVITIVFNVEFTQTTP